MTVAVGRHEKLFETILGGRSDANVDFDELCALLIHLGFAQRIRGSHHMFTRNSVDELINLQRSGSGAKSYQVRQVRRIIRRYNLELP